MSWWRNCACAGPVCGSAGGEAKFGMFHLRLPCVAVVRSAHWSGLRRIDRNRAWSDLCRGS